MEGPLKKLRSGRRRFYLLLMGAVEKPGRRPLRRSLTTKENFKSTPPLRGSRRAKGVSPQAIRWGDMPQSKPPPTASAFAKNARLLRLPLKGGVYLALSLDESNPR